MSFLSPCEAWPGPHTWAGRWSLAHHCSAALVSLPVKWADGTAPLEDSGDKMLHLKVLTLLSCPGVTSSVARPAVWGTARASLPPGGGRAGG